MNPILLLLVVASAAGLLIRRFQPRVPRAPAVAWALLGVAGMALLSPALSVPDGIPSPAARLGDFPPWQEISDPEEGNSNLIDVTYQIQPWLIFLREEMRQGRLPFWNPHQFAGAPFWANGQSAGFYPLHLLFVTLPLQLGFLLLPWLRFMIAGLGAWTLARRLGLGEAGALVAGLIFPLSGMLVSFLLFPMGNALALVPWVLWSVDRLASKAAGRLRWASLAIFGGLQFLAGHPETAVHTALLSALYLLVRGSDLAAWARWLLGWLLAAGLAAVQTLPLALNLLATSRWEELAEVSRPAVSTVLPLMLRGVLPELYGSAAAGTWWGPFNDAATALYAGALTLPLAAAGVILARRDRRWLAVTVVSIFSLLAAYHLPGFWNLLDHLPVVRRAAQHRLIFGVELGLALLAGAGCDRWLAGRGKGLLVGGAGAAAAVAVAWSLYRDDWLQNALLGRELGWTLWVLAAVTLLAASLLLSGRRRTKLWPLLPALLTLDLVAAHAPINPGLSLAKLYPQTGATAFIAGREGRLVGVGAALRPNSCMVYGCRDLRGDDPVKLRRFEKLYRELAPASPVYFRPIRRWRGDILDRLGVRWVVTGPEDGAREGSWRLAYEGVDARVWERPTALPLVRWADDREEFAVEVVEAWPGFWRLRYEATASGMLVVAETWDPGWRAQVSGRAVASIERMEDLVFGVPLEAGVGELVLRYRPPGLIAGAIAGLASSVVLIAGGIAAYRRRRREVCDNPVAE